MPWVFRRGSCKELLCKKMLKATGSKLASDWSSGSDGSLSPSDLSTTPSWFSLSEYTSWYCVDGPAMQLPSSSLPMAILFMSSPLSAIVSSALCLGFSRNIEISLRTVYCLTFLRRSLYWMLFFLMPWELMSWWADEMSSNIQEDTAALRHWAQFFEAARFSLATFVSGLWLAPFFCQWLWLWPTAQCSHLQFPSFYMQLKVALPITPKELTSGHTAGFFLMVWPHGWALSFR